MGCKPSKQSPESLRAANLRAMEKNKARGKDDMGHDKGIPRVTPGNPEQLIFMHQAGNGGKFLGGAGAALSIWRRCNDISLDANDATNAARQRRSANEITNPHTQLSISDNNSKNNFI